MNEVVCLKKVCICLYFLLLCFVTERVMDMLEEISREEIYPEPEVNEDIRILDNMEKYC